MKKNTSSVTVAWELLKQNWIIIGIVLVGVLLRTWQLDTKAIFFGDAARDVLVAADAVRNHDLPLLGIPSSMPQFKQGPVAIWISMATITLFGENLYAISLIFALVGIASIILIYELVTVFLDRRQGLVAAWLVATAPLAVAHARMPYHTNPIPFATGLFLWAVMRLWQAKRWSLFWAVLAWCFLFQFELALLPLIAIIPFVLWRTRQRWQRRWVGEAVLGGVLGLLPQIIFDLTHHFAQLGTFGVWVGYRLGSAVVPGADHAFGLNNVTQTAQAVRLYGGRIFSVDMWPVIVVGGVFLVMSAVLAIRQVRQKKLPPLIEITWVSTVLLILSFLIHSSPSEAYFPVFIVLLPILVAYAVFQLKQRARQFAVALVILIGVINAVSIVRANYFVGLTGGFSYGAGPGEQLLIVMTVNETTNGTFFFTTIQPAGVFPSYFDNLRWWARQLDVSENPNGVAVFIEPKDSSLDSYPGMSKQQFTTIDAYYYE